MDCQTVWNPGGGDSSSSSGLCIDRADTRGCKCVITGGQATAYSHPSQLDPRLSLASLFSGDPRLGDPNAIGPKLRGANAGDETAVVDPEGRWSVDGLGCGLSTVE